MGSHVPYPDADNAAAPWSRSGVPAARKSRFCQHPTG